MGWADALKQQAAQAAAPPPVEGPPGTTQPIGPRPVAPDPTMANPSVGGGQAPGDPWEAQLLATLEARYGKDNPIVAQQFDYYKNDRRPSGEVSGRVGPGKEFPTMDAYWLHRASGMDAQDQPGYMGGQGGFSLQGVNGLSSFNAPGLLAPYTQGFQDRFEMPTPENMLASPSYQWNLSRGLDALDKRGAARGTINTGGQEKDRMEFASGLASQEYDKNFDRGLALRASDMGLYGMNRDTFWGNQANAFNRLNTTAGLGLTAAGNYANNVSSIYENMANANAANQQTRGSNTGNLVGGGISTGLGALFDWLGNRGKG